MTGGTFTGNITATFTSERLKFYFEKVGKTQSLYVKEESKTSVMHVVSRHPVLSKHVCKYDLYMETPLKALFHVQLKTNKCSLFSYFG